MTCSSLPLVLLLDVSVTEPFASPPTNRSVTHHLYWLRDTHLRISRFVPTSHPFSLTASLSVAIASVQHLRLRCDQRDAFRFFGFAVRPGLRRVHHDPCGFFGFPFRPGRATRPALRHLWSGGSPTQERAIICQHQRDLRAIARGVRGESYRPQPPSLCPPEQVARDPIAVVLTICPWFEAGQQAAVASHSAARIQHVRRTQPCSDRRRKLLRSPRVAESTSRKLSGSPPHASKPCVHRYSFRGSGKLPSRRGGNRPPAASYPLPPTAVLSVRRAIARNRSVRRAKITW
jgi:hypothetical protein